MIDFDLRREARNPPLPHLLAPPIENNDIEAVVGGDQLQLPIIVHISNGHLPLDFGHGDWPARLHVALVIDDVEEAEACAQDHLQLAVVVEVGHRGRGVDVGPITIITYLSY